MNGLDIKDGLQAMGYSLRQVWARQLDIDHIRRLLNQMAMYPNRSKEYRNIRTHLSDYLSSGQKF